MIESDGSFGKDDELPAVGWVIHSCVQSIPPGATRHLGTHRLESTRTHRKDLGRDGHQRTWPKSSFISRRKKKIFHGEHQSSSLAMTTAALLFLLSLLLANFNAVGAIFVQPPSKLKPYPNLQLATADRSGVSYRGIAYDAGKEASFAGFALSLNAEFGPLDKATFEKLQTAYCSWSETKSKVVWKDGKNYTLLDFLPPLLQAVSGLHFRSIRTTQKGLPSFLGGPNDRVKLDREQEVLLTSNCWGFAWEVLFQADNADTTTMTISTADPTSAWRAFTSTGFDLIQSTRTQPDLLTDKAKRIQKIQGGDVLLIWHQNPATASGTDLYLDHVATCIDEDVYFEKSGSGDRVPFRISTWEMITANFPPSIFFWEWRRLVRNNPRSPNVYGSVPRLQPATELFGVDSQIASVDASNQRLVDRFSFLKKLRPDVAQRISLQTDIGDGDVVEGQTYTGILVLEDLKFDKTTGRAYLPKSAFLPDWYQKAQQLLPPTTQRK